MCTSFTPGEAITMGAPYTFWGDLSNQRVAPGLRRAMKSVI